MAVFEKERRPKNEGEEEQEKRREASHVSANKLGKALATVMLVVIFLMLLLYFWPYISKL